MALITGSLNVILSCIPFFADNEELKKYSEKLSTLPQIVVLTKTDLLPEEELKEKIKNFEHAIIKNSAKKPLILTISSITQKGLENLKNVVWNHLEKIPKSPPIEVEVTDFDKRDKTSINITRKEGKICQGMLFLQLITKKN